MNKRKRSVKKSGQRKRYTINAAAASPTTHNHHSMQQIRFVAVLQVLVILTSFVLFTYEHDLMVEQQTLEEARARITAAATIEITQEITDEAIKQEITQLVNGIWADNKALLQGISSILVASEDLNVHQGELQEWCPDPRLLGAYQGDKIYLRHTDAELTAYTLYHEIGHNVWKHLPVEDKEIWTVLFEETQKFITRYSAKNPQENFAENLACYYTNFQECHKQMYEVKKEFIEKIVA